MKDEGRLVTVEINGLRYPIRSHLDAAYVLESPYGGKPQVSAESLDVAWWPVDALPEAVVPDLPARLHRILAGL